MIDPYNPDYTNTPVSPSRPIFGYTPTDKTAKPLVSIITPFFNTGVEFLETVKCVLGQSLQAFEWIIVDDGSTDSGALHRLAEAVSGDNRICVVRLEKNQGLSAARNLGTELAKSEYVMLLDSDDLLEPTAIEKLFWFLNSRPTCSFVTSYSVGFNEQTYLWRKGFHSGRDFLHENCTDANLLLRRSVWQQVGGFDIAMKHGMEDWDFWLKCANAGFWGDTLPEFLEWYRRRANHADRWADWHKVIDIRQVLRAKYPKLWESFPNTPQPSHKPYQPLPIDYPANTNILTKSKKRLLLILPWLSMGGADKFNLDVIQQLTQQNWNVSIVTTLLSDNCWLAQFAQYTPDIFVLDNFLPRPDYPRFLKYLIESRQPDICCISNSELGYHLLPFIRANFPHITLVDYCHMEQEEWKSGGYPNLAVQHQSMLDINIVSSLHLKEWQIQRGAAPERIKVCYTNIDSNLWHRDEVERVIFRKKHEIDAETPVILYAGRLVQQKQPDVFIETIHALLKKEHNFVAAIAGNGPYLTFLQNYVGQHRLDKHIRFVGALSNQEMKNALSASDIFFLPSEWEGISLTIYEAMSMGLAIIGADVGGQRELVTAECGYLIPRSDPSTEAAVYATVLSELLTNTQIIRQMGAAARERVRKQFRIEQMVDTMLGAFDLAQHFQQTVPRAIIDSSTGWWSAHLAIEYQRLNDAAEYLWAQREVGAGQFSITYYIYRLLQRRFGWFYRWMLKLPNGRLLKQLVGKTKSQFNNGTNLPS